METDNKARYEKGFDNFHNLCSYFLPRLVLSPIFFMVLALPLFLLIAGLLRIGTLIVLPSVRQMISVAQHIKKPTSKGVEKENEAASFRKLLWAYLVGIKQKDCPRIELIE